MRNKYLLSPDVIEKYLGVSVNDKGIKQMPHMNALSITLLLYYFSNKAKYRELKELVVAKACERIASTPKDLRKKTSEIVILLLDLMACPYLDDKEKKKVGNSFELKAEETKKLLSYFKNGRYMFTNWNKLNVTKELNAKISQEVYA